MQRTELLTAARGPPYFSKGEHAGSLKSGYTVFMSYVLLTIFFSEKESSRLGGCEKTVASTRLRIRPGM